MKKMFSLALALIMALALCVPAFAAQGSEDDATTGSITVDNTVEGKEYSIYRIFALESFKHSVDGEADAYAYKVIDVEDDDGSLTLKVISDGLVFENTYTATDDKVTTKPNQNKPSTSPQT